MISFEIATPPTTDVTAGLKRFLSKLCISITLFLVLLVLGEAAAYVYLRLNPTPSVYAGLPLRADYARELDNSAKHQYLPFVEWRRQPYRGRYISVDEEGVRQTVGSDCSDKKNTVIWMFGDSALWGTGVADSETIPSHLARLYNNSGQKICIKNFGEAAWVSTQELIELLLQLKQSDRPPNIVIFYDGTDEIFMPDPGAPKDIHQGYRRFRELLATSQAQSKPGLWFLRNSNTVRALDLLSQKLNRSRSRARRDLSPAVVATVTQNSVHNYEKNLDIVDALAHTYGFRPLYLWYPTSIFSKKPLTHEERDAVKEEAEESPARFQLRQATYAICQSLKRPNFVYLGDALDHEDRRLYLDGAHLTSEGNALMAERIFDTLGTKNPSVPR